MTTVASPDPASDYTSAKAGLYGAAFDYSRLPANVQAVVMGYRWATALEGSQPPREIAYGFGERKEDYAAISNIDWTGKPVNWSEVVDNFSPLSTEQRAAVVEAFALITSYTGLKFTNSGSPAASANTLRIGNSDDSLGAFPTNDGDYFKVISAVAGNSFMGSNGKVPAQYYGTDGFTTIMHEIGHTLGLKHGHDFERGLSEGFNNSQYSLMTYSAYEQTPRGDLTEQRAGSAPQGYMMFDIAALQALYNANFDRAGKKATWSWDADGQQYIDGLRAPGNVVTSTKKIFTTVWTQGAISTYDLSNFNESQVDDMRPSGFLKFSAGQLADLNSKAAPGTPDYIARGNVYNALLSNDDPRSLVRNIKTGSGDDSITGNDADNVIEGGAGNDTIFGGAGNDTISGGPGADRIDGGSGVNTLRDTLADMAGDTIVNMGTSTGLKLGSAAIGHDHLAITPGAGGVTLELGGISINLTGSFEDGAFMAVPRGTGADAVTDVSFARFLPGLSEGVHVDAAAINGIANPAFLRGDGVAKFTATLEGVFSAFGNAIGAYRVADSGAIAGVHLMFANTHAVAVGTTLALDTPAGGESLGFFLVQDAASRFGLLPDDLSFADIGGHRVLSSASLGLLDAATVFHAGQAFNPGNAVQVLSGVSADGRDLRIGFEDLPNGQGDNDFQDVVIRVHTDRDGLLVV